MEGLDFSRYLKKDRDFSGIFRVLLILLITILLITGYEKMSEKRDFWQKEARKFREKKEILLENNSSNDDLEGEFLAREKRLNFFKKQIPENPIIENIYKMFSSIPPDIQLVSLSGDKEGFFSLEGYFFKKGSIEKLEENFCGIFPGQGVIIKYNKNETGNQETWRWFSVKVQEKRGKE